MNWTETKNFKILEERNKHLSENYGMSFIDCLKNQTGFTPIDHILISILEMIEMDSSVQEHLEFHENEVEMNISSTPFWLTNILFIPIYKFDDMCVEDGFNINPYSSIIQSFINRFQEEDMIIRYIQYSGPLQSIGFYLLVRKINGRYELMDKIRYYVS